MSKSRNLLNQALLLMVIGVSVIVCVPSKAYANISYNTFYDSTSSSCAPGLAGTVTASGVMSLRFPGFSDEVLLAEGIDAFIRKESPNSPWLTIPDFASRFIEEAKRLDINPLLVIVIGKQESNFGVTGDSAIRGFNSFGNKGSNGFNGYRAWPSWEASLFGGDGLSSGLDQSFTAATKYRINGGHPSYTGVTNMYEYLSVHLTGRIFREGDQTRVFDDIMGEYVDLSGVNNYYSNAVKWVSEITGQVVATGSGLAAADCGTTGVVNGSVVQTALALAWTEQSKVAELMAGRDATNGLCSMEAGDPAGCGQQKAAAGALIREQDAKPNYVSAVKQYNPGNDSDSSNWAFSDCGVFVATVMRSSGVDPDYAARGTTASQLPYLRESANYEIVPFTDTSQLLPGDILITEGHTAIYVGPNNITDAVVVQASWGQHVPAANQRTVTPGNDYFRARRV